MQQDPKSLLIDVHDMDFVCDLNDSSQPQTENLEVNSNSYDNLLEQDPATGELMLNLTSKEDLPLKHNEKGILKFKFSPISRYDTAWLIKQNRYALYPVIRPNVDVSSQFPNYVHRLFEIYKSLGDHRVYSVPTMGVINSGYEKDHNDVLNLAMDSLVLELKSYIKSRREHERPSSTILDLEESLTILSCLKLVYFILDSSDQSSTRNEFIYTLTNWVNRSDGEPSAEYIELVFNSCGKNAVYESPLFWKLLAQLLLRGLFEQVVGCVERSGLLAYLRETCDVSANAVKDFIALIERYPVDSPSTFREWKALALELSNLYSNSQTSISEDLRNHIEGTLLLVSGDQSKILLYSSVWYESFSGFLLYYIPSLELSNEYLKLSIDNHPVDVTNNWEQPCVDIIRGSVHLILPILQSLDDCTASFTAAFCEAKGLLENSYAEIGGTLSEGSNEESGSEALFSRRNGMACYLLNNFAFDLCSYGDKVLWPVAVGLIALSPAVSSTAKRAAIGELLPHFPYETNDDLEWMLSVCAEWKLPYVAKSLYTILGSTMLAENKNVEALANYSKAGRFDMVKGYTWLFFEVAVIRGKPLDDDILNIVVEENNVGKETSLTLSQEVIDALLTPAMRQALAPYAVLCKYYEAQDGGNWERALELLMSLIEFRYLPNYYLILLIARFLYPVFLLDDTKRISEPIILSLISILEEKWESSDPKSQDLYSVLRDENLELQEVLPENLEVLNRIVREKLNFKMCQQFTPINIPPGTLA